MYNYDTNGNLISKLSVNSEGDSQELEKYTYDSFNRLSSVKKGNQTFDYLYDGNGKRIQKNSAVSQLQEFWYNDKIVFEGLSKINESEQNQSYYSYTFDNDLLSVSETDSSINLAVVNSHGDTVDLLSVETPYFTEYKYDSYGNQVSKNIPNIHNPYQYNGKYFDDETGFYYLNARYYNPAVGRFMQEDTYHGQIKNASTLNLYNYCGSNPIAYEDGTGHFWETAFDIAGLAWSVYDFAKKPNLWNGICVAWDVIALVAPCIPGSYVAKGAKLLYKGAKYVVKTSKSSKRANKLIKTLDKAHDTYKAYKKSKNSYKCYETSAEIYRKKKQIVKDNTEKNVKSLVNSAKHISVSKGRKFTQESAEQVSKKMNTINNLPKQTHHFLTNKNSKYTQRFESIVKKYGLTLDESWNKELMPHRGRHPNAYHDYMLDRVLEIDSIALGNKRVFLSGFSDLKKEIISNPEMLRKSYWR